MLELVAGEPEGMVSVDDLLKLLTEADTELGSLRELVDEAFALIKSQCQREGKLDAGLLDDRQLVSFELAFCVAEISAARAFNSYALQLGQSEITSQISLSFSAEIIQTVLQRLISRSVDIGRDRNHLLDFYTRPIVKLLLDTYLASESLASIGQEITEKNLQRLPSNLDEEKELMRETFFRFANDIVMPLAENIHREDQDIPDSILRPATALGCFGTCIPERFGG